MSNKNSSTPTTAEIVGGVYASGGVSLLDGQAAAFQLDSSGNLKVTSSGSGTGNVNIAQVAGSTPALSNPLPVELSDGSAAIGTSSNPLVEVLNARRSNIGTASVQNTGASGTLIAGISSTYADIITLVLTNESSTATIVSISDGTTTYKFAIAANGGGVFQFPTPLPAANQNTNWTISNSASSTIDAVVVYVKN